MRRPLNWVVVCLSLLFLLANLSRERKPEMVAGIAPALAENRFAGSLTLERSEPQFGYVRADGSFQPLTGQDEVPAVTDVGTAVYVWSSPISASKVPASF